MWALFITYVWWLWTLLVAAIITIYYTMRLLGRFLSSPRTCFRKGVRPLDNSTEPYGDFTKHRIPVDDGLSLHGVSHGLETRRPLIRCQHGFPQGSQCWRHQLRSFRDTHAVLAVDMRGYGYSDIPSGGLRSYGMDWLVLDVARVIRWTGRSRCTLVGHDFGGAVAWSVAATMPHLLTGVVVLSAPHPAAIPSLAQIYRSLYVLLFLVPGLAELWISAQNFRFLDHLFLSREREVGGVVWGVQTPGALSQAEVDRYKAMWARPGTLTAALGYYRAAVRERTLWNSQVMEKTLTTRLAMPVLLLYGNQDGAFLPSTFRDTGSMVAGPFRSVEVPSASHWLPEDRPSIVNREIAAFLAKPVVAGERSLIHSWMHGGDGSADSGLGWGWLHPPPDH